MTYIPIHLHTQWSILDSTVHIPNLMKKAVEYKIPAICLTDHSNLKGVVQFFKEANNNDIIPIIGCEVNTYNIHTKKLNRLTLIAKNKTGYFNLIKLVSISNKKIEENPSQDIPYLNIDDLINYRTGLICLIGDIFSEISDVIFTDREDAYKSSTKQEIRSFLRDDAKDRIKALVQKYENIFSNVFTFFDYGDLPILKAIKHYVTNYTENWLPSNNIHYLNQEDKNIHEIILKSRVDKVKKVTDDMKDFHDYRIFYTKDPKTHLEESIEGGERTLQLLKLIEKYEIRSNPILPNFKINDHIVKNSNEYLRELYVKGYKEKGLNKEKNKPLKDRYGERIKKELDIFTKANIAGYFLIVKDIIDFAKKCGLPVDVRGSATGCMGSYLLGFSSIDPLRPDPAKEYSEETELPLERFYNEGRNTKENVSMPDIDIDIPSSFREHLIEYVRRKYGKDCVGHIITHQRFKGKGALKEVFKLVKPTSNYFEICNDITKRMTDEAKISDELAEIRKEEPDYGIIQWNIDNVNSVKEAYDNYKEIFDIAISLEQLAKNESVHAAGIIISNQPLQNLFPIRYLSSIKEMVIDIEGSDIEYIGGVKIDILSVSMLEKTFLIQQMVNGNKNEIEYNKEEDYEEEILLNI